MMQGSVGRMAGLIDDMMDLARSRLGGGIALNRTRASRSSRDPSGLGELRPERPTG